MRTVLGTQVLVQKVESSVAPARTKRGDAFHIRKVLVPQEISSLADARDAALTLATHGSPIPPNAILKKEWVASFQLSGRLRRLLAKARPGDYVGPIRKPTGYMVVQLLGHGFHGYEWSTRQQLITQYFHSWLKKVVQSEHPKCFDEKQRVASCPVGL